MTREEAIRELKQFSGTTRLRLSANFWEALNRAIKLLEQEPCEDAISRRAVLNLATVIETDDFSGNEIMEVVETDGIKALPSVTPAHKLKQEPMENFESTKDHILKLAGDYKCWDNRLTHDEALELCHMLEQEPCEDAISRKRVLNTLFYNSDNNCEVVLNKELQDRIKSLPPVKPVACIATVKFSKEDMQELVNEKMKDIVVERKKGKWINKSQKSGCGITLVASECTCCGKKTLFNCDELLYRYCPNCGAEMESE